MIISERFNITLGQCTIRASDAWRRANSTREERDDAHEIAHDNERNNVCDKRELLNRCRVYTKQVFNSNTYEFTLTCIYKKRKLKLYIKFF